MQKLLLKTLLLSIFCSSVYAQRIEISGVLTDKLGNIADAHIVNKTTKQGTFSKLNGEFKIKVQPDDVIVISSVQHHNQTFTYSKSALTNNQLKIFLYLKDYLLEEVEVKKTDLQGILSNDSKSIGKSNRQEVMENLGFDPFPKKMSKIDREIKTAYAGGVQIGLGAMVSLDYIINSMSGRIDMLEKQKKLLENEKKLKYMEYTYRHFITKSLNIDSSQVARFLYFSHFDTKFNESFNGGDIKIIHFLKEQAVLFKKDSL
ncbi:carboxypeptidase-like regulatory domain-containing protein [Tenacibaculum sp. 190524A05c]|uniref:Carboxypeptidase-like protein n=1 Tax=Tenacibaculum platacis TaxID=3137852 RepID=A0ABM9P141_9FLAO